MNVLLTGVSRRAELVHAFHRAVSRIGGAVVVAEHNLFAVSQPLARTHRVVPPDGDGYIEQILRISLAEQVGLVVPTPDVELSLFANAVSQFEDAGVRVAVSPLATLVTCRDGYQLAPNLTRRGIATLEAYLPEQLPETIAFPLVVGPRYADSGDQSFFVRDMQELRFFVNYLACPIVRPYLGVPELAVDVTCDFSGSPVSVMPRSASSTSALSLVRRCVNALPFVGAVTIRYSDIGGRSLVTGIEPRLGESFPLVVQDGDTVADLFVDCARAAQR
jgi:carbamoyl-phosphate synthase large subunit